MADQWSVLRAQRRALAWSTDGDIVGDARALLRDRDAQQARADELAAVLRELVDTEDTITVPAGRRLVAVILALFPTEDLLARARRLLGEAT